MEAMRRMSILTVHGVMFLALLTALGCTSTKVTERDEYQGAQLPRPGRILVHDFAATPTDLPAWSAARRQFAGAAAEQTPEELEAGRKLGTEVAKALVEQISEMGLPAVRAEGEPSPRENDLVLVGYFASVDTGSAMKRVVVGFGSGSAELKTHVEGYRMTDRGIEKLGSGAVDSGGTGRTPGVVLPAVVTVATMNPIGLAVGGAVKAAGEVSGASTIEGTARRTADKIAEELEKKFAEQGWIED